MHSYIEWSTMSIFIRSSHRFTLWVWCITFCCNSLHVTVAIHSYQTIPDLSNHSQQHQRIETTAHSMVHNLFMTHAFANIIQLLYVLCIMACFFFWTLFISFDFSRSWPEISLKSWHAVNARIHWWFIVIHCSQEKHSICFVCATQIKAATSNCLAYSFQHETSTWWVS